MKTNYQASKERARAIAIEYQAIDAPMSWGEIAELSDYLERLGRRFGLLREFRNNGVI